METSPKAEEAGALKDLCIKTIRNVCLTGILLLIDGFPVPVITLSQDSINLTQKQVSQEGFLSGTMIAAPQNFQPNIYHLYNEKVTQL